MPIINITVVWHCIAHTAKHHFNDCLQLRKNKKAHQSVRLNETLVAHPKTKYQAFANVQSDLRARSQGVMTIKNSLRVGVSFTTQKPRGDQRPTNLKKILIPRGEFSCVLSLNKDVLAGESTHISYSQTARPTTVPGGQTAHYQMPSISPPPLFRSN